MPSINSIVTRLSEIIGDSKVGLHEPEFNGREWEYLKNCLDSNYVSSVGKYVDEFEKLLVDFTGAKHAVAVVNGTAALHLALIVAGVEHGNEVLVPSLTFVATANAVTYCGATPHFVDCGLENLGVDPDKLRDYLVANSFQRDKQCINSRTGRVIKAIIPMHFLGHSSKLNELCKIAFDFNIQLIEDAAESLGSYYYGYHTGTIARMGVFSFNGNKIITTGGGGAIVTNDSLLAARLKHLSTTAKINHPWEFVHDNIGFNYRMPNINAALGCAQLEGIASKLERKRNLFKKYMSGFDSMSGIRVLQEPDGCQSNYWLQALIIASLTRSDKEELLRVTNSIGYTTRPAWTPMHKLEIYKDSPRMDLNNCDWLCDRLICLPSSPALAN